MTEDVLTTEIWEECPEPQNGFAAKIARCHGFDVYGDLLGRVSWSDMIYLLFKGEPAAERDAVLLNHLAVALANPGPRDASVHAAMCGGVAGSPAAACLMAALSVGAGKVYGGRDVFMATRAWYSCNHRFSNLALCLTREVQGSQHEVWLPTEHWPGFDPYPGQTASVVVECLEYLARNRKASALEWLANSRGELEILSGTGLALTGVAAAAYYDLGMCPQQAEMLFLMMRLPGAAAHALEQRQRGFKAFPFGDIEVSDAGITESETNGLSS